VVAFQLMMFGVGATVGTGIFFVLPECHRHRGLPLRTGLVRAT
jgi:hypothetical protein